MLSKPLEKLLRKVLGQKCLEKYPPDPSISFIFLQERRNVLLKFADLWDQHKEELSKIVCLVRKPQKQNGNFECHQECGKPLVFAKTADNLFPIEHLRYFAG